MVVVLRGRLGLRIRRSLRQSMDRQALMPTLCCAWCLEGCSAMSCVSAAGEHFCSARHRDLWLLSQGVVGE